MAFNRSYTFVGFVLIFGKMISITAGKFQFELVYSVRISFQCTLAWFSLEPLDFLTYASVLPFCIVLNILIYLSISWSVLKNLAKNVCKPHK